MPQGYEVADLLHHFSAETLISLELPLEWGEESEDERTAVYMYQPFDDTYGDEEVERTAPRLAVRLIAVPGAPADVLERLSAALLGKATGDVQVRSTKAVIVDGLPGKVTVFECDAPEGGRRITWHQAFVQWDDVVFSFAGTCPSSERDTYLPQFEAALASARVVPLTSAQTR